MNVIWITVDSLRYDHLGANGNSWIKTPGLDAFAGKSLVCDRAFSLSLPTIPNRTDLFTGRYTFPRRGWTVLPKEEVTAAQRFAKLGMHTQMFFDTYHLKNNGYNFDRGFSGWQWIRGQEGDRFLTPLPRESIRIHPTRPEIRLSEHSGVAQEFSNLQHRRFEADYISPQTYSAAERWLEYNHDKGPFFLYIDSFDPHEPWDPPAYYVSLYDSGYEGEVIAFPATYCFTDGLPQELVRKAQLLYAGEVTMVDRWLGRLLQKIEDLRLLDNTLVAVMSDHGFLIGEHGRMGKRNRDGKRLFEKTGDERYSHPWPLYRQVNQLVMMIHAPGMDGGRRSSAIVQPQDILPTTLEWLGEGRDGDFEGRSFLPVLKGETDRGRDCAITSFELMTHRNSFNAISCVTDGRWRLHFSTRPGETTLFDLESDPEEGENVLAANRDVAEGLHRLFYETIKDKVNDPKKAELLGQLPS
jgi:arylsulfatase A-like enzyme